MARLLDESGNQLLDERSYILLDEQPEPHPVVITPRTKWRPTNGLSEFGGSSANNIVDPSGNFLVDPSGVFIVDTGVTETLIPRTVWEEDDTI
jgi:hypothetical protein